jgi:glutamate N-acetyltransferase/amino-acid N-acetyltransferase
MLVKPHGFTFAAARAGFKYAGRPDLGLMLSDRPAASAGVFTRNSFQAAPVLVARQLLAERQTARAIVVNAGQANACTGQPGLEDCRHSLELVAGRTGLEPEEILPASTGVIGPRMDRDLWRQGVERLALPEGSSDEAVLEVARAMTTTDTFPKLAWRTLDLSGGRTRILGLAKGAGMICPNMATMLGFLVTDLELEPSVWRRMLAEAAKQSFNRISIDGDTSTNDCLLGLANGASLLGPAGGEEPAVQEALTSVCQELARLIVQDAEGGSKVVRIRVIGAADDGQAEAAARAVAHSPLVKTAFFGQDANWGRIVAAVGRSGAELDPDQVTLRLGGRTIFREGRPAGTDLDDLLAPVMERDEIDLEIDLGGQSGRFELLTSDLSTEYVRINADYRS